VGPRERWIDIDLDSQVLVAYEGSEPVFTTLVSTGARRSPTATGTYRIWVKFAETDMNGQMDGEAPYSVATVPWTQFFAVDLALHTAYWHDKFATPRSHGCVNLAPRDARWVYDFAEEGTWVYVFDPSGNTPTDPAIYGPGGA
jgi:lipoprotein-anchoring transpeptidase ErfK/SrfK